MFADHIDWNVPLHWSADNILTRPECEALIARIDAAKPELATINAPGGPVIDTRTRNNTRVIFDDPELAALLYERVRPHVPERMMGMRAVGANERFRCYRYDVGQRFAPHYDGSFVRDNGEHSLLTFMIYLCEGFTGGETHFLDLDVSVVPRTGMALLFQHRILHESVPVSAGVKYAIRSDIMFEAKAA